MKSTLLVLTGSLLLALQPASGDSIGINLGSNRANSSLATTDVAGVVPQGNWNNAGSASGGPLALNDDSGAGSGASVTWASNEEWSVQGGAPADANGVLLNGFIAEFNNAPFASVDVTSIPYAAYDLYLYVSHDRTSEDVIISEAGGAFTDFTAVWNNTNLNAPVTLVQQTTSGTGSGNYVLFSGLSAPSLSIDLEPVDLGPGTIDRNAISGIQIVGTTVTPGLPSVANLAPSGITASAASANGDLLDNGDGADTATLTIYWGTSDGGAVAGDWATAAPAGSRTSPGAFSAALSGLLPNTTYFYRAFVSNSAGDAWAASSESFTTPAALPTVQNIAATGVTGTEATVGGDVTSTGGETPNLVIHYGDNDAGVGAWDAQLDLGATAGSASGDLTGLTPGTTYYFRAAATNTAGTAWAATSATFSTTPVNLPAVANAAASGVNGTFATLNGTVTDTGGDTPTVTIYYGTGDGGEVAGAWDLSTSAGSESAGFSELIVNLQPTTTYYFRAFAQNIVGGAWAPSSLSFTTPVFTPPTVVINEIHYDEDNKTVRAEFIELFNPSDDPVDLGGYYFSDGIDYVFPGGTTLPAGGFVVVAEDPATLLTRYGYGGAAGPFANGTTLKNSGEQITLRDPAGAVVDEVDYGIGFPWPTVGDDIGTLLVSPSIELINPLLDNDLAGSWRASGFPASTVSGGGGPVNYIAGDATWLYLADGSDQGTAWQGLAFDDSTWAAGAAELGYGDGDETTVVPSGPAGGRYATTYFRKTVNIPDPTDFVSFTISVTYDDAYAIYVNGAEIARHSGLSANAPYDEYSTNSVGNNANDTLTVAAAAFAAEDNVVAVEIHQTNAGSSDISFALTLTGEVGGGQAGSFAPTPGAPNRSAATAAPPQVRQVDHLPAQPTSGQPVVVTAKVTDPDGVGSLVLEYQTVDPGDYFSRYLKFNTNGTDNPDPRYLDPAEWTAVTMLDDGTGGDALAGDAIYTATLPGALQTNRRLVRYRITATDVPGTGITVPYEDDPQPNFAYFVYDGTPDWSGVIRPGDTAVNYPGSVMSSIDTYFLLSTNAWVDDSQFGGYGGSEYLWPGTLVYDGKVYDHIQYRPRGGVHRFQYGKNFWKFDFGRGRRFEPRDRYGKKYGQPWDKLNFSSIVQQVGFNHRGEQGLFEGVGFKLFDLCGVEACNTHYAQFYVVDQASPTGANQYEGDYYGLYLAIEQLDGQFLDEHGLPDGNLYKIEGHSGDSNNQGPTQVSDRSDVSTFISAYRNGTPTAQWWEDNLDIDKYLSYRTIVEGIHHYDIAGGKNYFYYHNPETDKFEVHPWDLDLCWANNMFGSGNHDFKTKVAGNAAFNTRYQNRVREIMDLLYNTDEGYRLIDEMVRDVWTPGSPSLVSADRRLWDNNPRLNHKDRYYDVANDNDFSGMIQVLKNYIVSRGSWMTSNLLTQEASIPDTPTITFNGGAGFPSNDLQFNSSAYSSGTAFAAMEWRLSEVYNESTPNYVAGEPYVYEIDGATESGELAPFSSSYLFPALSARPGEVYRARVRHQDTAGRWSHWSAPLEFTASAPDVTQYIDSLRITEVHYHPSPATAAEQANGWDDGSFEFIEIQNIGPVAIDLTDVRFTKGIDFDFAASTLIDSDAYMLVVKDQTAFESRYGTGLPVAGEWAVDNQLSNGGENVKLSLGTGTAIIEFTYDDIAPWPTEPDGSGFSLTLNCPDATLPTDHSDPLAWRPSRLDGGSPGTDDHLDFSTWATGNGLGTGAPLTDDLDGDGLINLLEYALAADPGASSEADLPAAAYQLLTIDAVTEAYLTYSFRRQSASKDLTYSVEFSADLATWDPAGAVLVSTIYHADGTATDLWRAPAAAVGDPRQFMRLRVEG